MSNIEEERKLSEFSHVLESEQTGKGRQYVDLEGLWYPSVTTVLSKYQEEHCTWLSDWKKRIGEEEANRIRDAAASRGTAAHEDLEAKFLNKDHTLTSPFAEIAYSEFFSKTKLISMEEPLMYSGNYKSEPVRVAGRYDALVEIPSETFKFKDMNIYLKGGRYLSDLKTKDKTPRVDSLEAVFKNALQASAYYKMLGDRGESLDGFIIVYATVLKTKSYARTLYFEPMLLDLLWKSVTFPLIVHYHEKKEYRKTWNQSIDMICHKAYELFGVYNKCLHYQLE